MDEKDSMELAAILPSSCPPLPTLHTESYTVQHAATSPFHKSTSNTQHTNTSNNNNNNNNYHLSPHSYHHDLDRLSDRSRSPSPAPSPSPSPSPQPHTRTSTPDASGHDAADADTHHEQHGQVVKAKLIFIKPSAPPRLLFNLLLITSIFIYCLLLPLDLCLLPTHPWGLSYTLDILLCADFIARHRWFIGEGDLPVDYRGVMHAFMSDRLSYSLHLLSILPLDLFGFIHDERTVCAIRLLKFLHLLRVLMLLSHTWRYSLLYFVRRRRSEEGGSLASDSNMNISVDEVESEKDNKLSLSEGVLGRLAHWKVLTNPGIRKIIKIVLVYFLLIHIFACFWSLLTGSSRLTSSLYDSLPPSRLYLQSLYFTVVTMACIGYGDALPQSNAEIVVAIIMMITGFLMVGSIIAFTVPILAHQQSKEHQFQTLISRWATYFDDNAIPLDIRSRIFAFYYHAEKTRRSLDENEILGKEIPRQYSVDINFEIYGHILENIDFLIDAPSGLLRSLVAKMKSSVYSVGDIILFCGQSNHHLHVIASGEVALVHLEEDKNGEIIEHVNILKSNYFGAETFLFEDRVCEADVQVTEAGFCDIFSLSRADYSDIASSYPRYTLADVQTFYRQHHNKMRKGGYKMTTKANSKTTKAIEAKPLSDVVSPELQTKLNSVMSKQKSRRRNKSISSSPVGANSVRSSNNNNSVQTSPRHRASLNSNASQTSSTRLQSHRNLISQRNLHGNTIRTIVASPNKKKLSYKNSSKHSFDRQNAIFAELNHKKPSWWDSSVTIAYTSLFRRLWDIVSFLLLIYYLLVVPIQISFDNIQLQFSERQMTNEEIVEFANSKASYSNIIYNSTNSTTRENRFMDASDWFVMALSWMVDIFFLVDIYLRLYKFELEVIDEEATPSVDHVTTPSNHTHSRHGHVRHKSGGHGSLQISSSIKRSSTSVGHKYRHSVGLAADVLAAIPCEFILLFGIVPSQWLYFLRINRILRLHRFFSLFDRVEQELKNKFQQISHLIPMIKLFIYALIFCHIIGCFWFCLSYYLTLNGYENTWIQDDGILNANLSTRYVRAFLFALVTCATIGYGGIVPRNDVEMACIICIILFGIIMYIMLLASLTVTADNRHAAAHEQEQLHQVLRQYMKTRGVSKHVRQKIWFYYKSTHGNTMMRCAQEDELVNELPRLLKVELLAPMIATCFLRLQLFDALSDEFLDMLLGRLMSKTFAPHDIVARLGERSNNVYFIHRGLIEVRVMMAGHMRTLKTLEGEDCFGSDCLLYEIPPETPATFKCASICTVFVLTKADFDDLLLLFPDDYQTIQTKREQVAGLFLTPTDILAQGGAPTTSRKDRSHIRQPSQVKEEMSKSAMEINSDDSDSDTDDDNEKSRMSMSRLFGMHPNSSFQGDSLPPAPPSPPMVPPPSSQGEAWSSLLPAKRTEDEEEDSSPEVSSTSSSSNGSTPFSPVQPAERGGLKRLLTIRQQKHNSAFESSTLNITSPVDTIPLSPIDPSPSISVISSPAPPLKSALKKTKPSVDIGHTNSVADMPSPAEFTNNGPAFQSPAEFTNNQMGQSIKRSTSFVAQNDNVVRSPSFVADAASVDKPVRTGSRVSSFLRRSSSKSIDPNNDPIAIDVRSSAAPNADPLARVSRHQRIQRQITGTNMDKDRRKSLEDMNLTPSSSSTRRDSSTAPIVVVNKPSNPLELQRTVTLTRTQSFVNRRMSNPSSNSTAPSTSESSPTSGTRSVRRQATGTMQRQLTRGHSNPETPASISSLTINPQSPVIDSPDTPNSPRISSTQRQSSRRHSASTRRDSHRGFMRSRTLSKGAIRQDSLSLQSNMTTMSLFGEEQEKLIRYLPTSSFRSVWSAIGAMAMLYFCFIVPYRICFYSPYQHSYSLFQDSSWPLHNYAESMELHPSVYFDAVLDLFFLIDIYFHMFHFHYYENGVLQSDPEEIRLHYVHSELVLDLCGTIFFDWVILAVGGSGGVWALYWLRATRLIRLHRVQEYVDTISDYLENKLGSNSTGLSFLRQFTLLAIVFHLFACFWFLIGASENSQASWLSKRDSPVYGLTDSNVTQAYYYEESLYFIVVTMSTVGYGDIQPHTVAETWFTVVIIFGGLFIYASVTANIAALAANLDVAIGIYQQKMDIIKNYMHRNKLPNNIRKAIRSYYRNLWIELKGVEEKEILAQLPQILREEVCYGLYNDLIKNTQLFDDLTTHAQPFIRTLCTLFVFKEVPAGQYLFRKDEYAHHTYFVKFGQIDSLEIKVAPGLQTKEHLVHRYGKNMIINPENMMVPVPIKQSRHCRAFTEAIVLSLHHDPLFALLQSYPQIKSILIKRVKQLKNSKTGLMRQANTISLHSHRRFDPSTLKKTKKIIEDGEEIEVTDDEDSSSDSDSDDELDDEEKRIRKLKKWVIQRDSKFRLRWDIFALFCVLAYLVFVPILIAFSENVPPFTHPFFADLFWPSLAITYIFDIFFWFDLYFHIRRFGNKEHDPPLVLPSQITYYYFHRSHGWLWFMVDIVAQTPWDLISLIIAAFDPSTTSTITIQFVALVRIGRILYVARVRTYLESLDLFLDSLKLNINFQLQRIMKLVVFSLLMLNFMTCLWYFVGRFPVSAHGLHVSWLNSGYKAAIIAAGTKIEDYLYAFYWAIETITTTGYGDVTATNAVELIVNIFMILSGDVIYGTIIGSISVNASNKHAPVANYEKRMENLLIYFDHRQIPSLIKQRIFSYYQYVWDWTGGYDDDKVFHQFPFELQTDIGWFLYGDLLRSIPFFDHCTQSFLSHVATILKYHVFIEHETIYKAGDLGYSMYLLKGGTMTVLLTKDGIDKEIALEAPSIFGEVSFFMGTPRTATVRAATRSFVLELCRPEFESVLKYHPNYRLSIMDKFVRNVYPDLKAKFNARLHGAVSLIHGSSQKKDSAARHHRGLTLSSATLALSLAQKLTHKKKQLGMVGGMEISKKDSKVEHSEHSLSSSSSLSYSDSNASLSSSPAEDSKVERAKLLKPWPRPLPLHAPDGYVIRCRRRKKQKDEQQEEDLAKKLKDQMTLFDMDGNKLNDDDSSGVDAPAAAVDPYEPLIPSDDDEYSEPQEQDLELVSITWMRSELKRMFPNETPIDANHSLNTPNMSLLQLLKQAKNDEEIVEEAEDEVDEEDDISSRPRRSPPPAPVSASSSDTVASSSPGATSSDETPSDNLSMKMLITSPQPLESPESTNFSPPVKPRVFKLELSPIKSYIDITSTRYQDALSTNKQHRTSLQVNSSSHLHDNRKVFVFRPNSVKSSSSTLTPSPLTPTASIDDDFKINSSPSLHTDNHTHLSPSSILAPITVKGARTLTMTHSNTPTPKSQLQQPSPN